jgi:hypothetical protein
MNSRCFTASASRAPNRKIAHLRIAGDCCVAGFRLGQCLLWVIFDPRGRSDTSLFVRFAPKATFTNQDVIRRFVPKAT